MERQDAIEGRREVVRIPRWLSGIIAVGCVATVVAGLTQGRIAEVYFGSILALGNAMIALLPDDRKKG